MILLLRHNTKCYIFIRFTITGTSRSKKFELFGTINSTRSIKLSIAAVLYLNALGRNIKCENSDHRNTQSLRVKV